MYAQIYRRGDIVLRYCAGCPVGRATGRMATDRDLSSATLRLVYQLKRAAKKIAKTLEEIAYDGVIDECERPVFDASLASLRELGETITDIMLCSMIRDIKTGAAPVPTENSPSKKPIDILRERAGNVKAAGGN
jgi:hypothetical protein